MIWKRWCKWMYTCKGNLDTSKCFSAFGNEHCFLYDGYWHESYVFHHLCFVNCWLLIQAVCLCDVCRMALSAGEQLDSHAISAWESSAWVDSLSKATLTTSRVQPEPYWCWKSMIAMGRNPDGNIQLSEVSKLGLSTSYVYNTLAGCLLFVTDNQVA